MAPGETAQFHFVAQLTDGSSRDVTNEARWFSSGSALSIEGPGLAKGRERGEATIQSVYESYAFWTSWKEVIVVPAGTYRLAGFVTEAIDPRGPVAGARLEVTSGGGAGLFTTTAEDGRYRLYGVSGTTNILIIRPR